jgi:uncharacterized membrane protein
MMKSIMNVIWVVIGVISLTILINSFFNGVVPNYIGGISFAVLVLGIGSLIAINERDY